MGLEKLKGSLDQIAEVGTLALRVVDLVAKVCIGGLKQVHHRQDLSVVGHKCLTNSVGAGHECLEDLERYRDDLGITGVKGGYNVLS